MIEKVHSIKIHPEGFSVDFNQPKKSACLLPVYSSFKLTFVVDSWSECQAAGWKMEQIFS
jgi:hypothetical protein